jgi:hypothetical protein
MARDEKVIPDADIRYVISIKRHATSVEDLLIFSTPPLPHPRTIELVSSITDCSESVSLSFFTGFFFRSATLVML